MSSTLSVIVKSLAPALGVPEATVSDWLRAAIYRACEELLLSGSVPLAGIGTLRKAHIPSRPVEQNGAMLVAPPRYGVELLPETDDGNGGFLYDVALETLSLDDDLAEKFSAGFAAAVQKTLEFKKRVELEQLGAIVLSDNGVEIEPSEWLLDLLNKPYQHLVAIPLSEKSDDQTPQGKSISVTGEPSKVEPPSTPRAAESAEPTHAPAANLTSPPPAPPQIPHVEFNPADFGLDSTTTEKPNDNKIFLEQSGLLAELEGKRGRAEKKKTPFQPPILPPEQVEPLLSSSAKEPMRILLENEDVPPVEKTKKAETEIEAPPPLRTPKEGLSKGALFMLIGVGVAVVAIVLTFFFVVRSMRTFPTSSPAATGAVPAATNPMPEKSSAPQASEEPKVKKSAESGNPAPTPAAEEKRTKSAAEPSRPVAAQSNLPPELSTPVSEAKGGWSIVVASRPTEAEAREVANTFAQKGFNVSIKPRTVNGELRYRVRVGQFAQQSDAQQAIKQYSAQLPKGAFLDKIQ